MLGFRQFRQFITTICLLLLTATAVAAGSPETLERDLTRVEETLTKSVFSAERQLNALQDALSESDLPRHEAIAAVLHARIQQRYGNIDNAKLSLRNAIRIFESIPPDPYHIKALLGLGTVYQTTGDFYSAAILYRQALELSAELDDKRGAIYAQINLASLSSDIGDEQSALEHLRAAASEVDRTQDTALIDLINYNTARTYQKDGQYELARRWYEDILVAHDSAEGASQLRAATLANLGVIANATGEYVNARTTLEKALQTTKDAGLVRDQNYVLHAMAENYIAVAQIDNAIKTANLAIENARTTRDVYWEARSMVIKASALQAASRDAEAIEVLQNSLIILERLELLNEKSLARAQLAQSYANQGLYEKAWEAERLAQQDAQLAQSQRNQLKINELRVAHKVDSVIARNDKLQRELERDAGQLARQQAFIRTQLVIVLLLSVALIAIAIIFFKQRVLQGKLLRLATTDPLTKIPNRTAVVSFGKDVYRRAQANDTKMSVMLIDIDNFKNINDMLGHDSGDNVLRRVSDCLNNSMRDNDMIGRIGGEEYLAIMPDSDMEQASAVAERMRALVQDLDFSDIGRFLKVTISVGVATCDAQTAAFAELMKHADRRLYKAKEMGRNCVFYAPDGGRTGRYATKSVA